MDASLKIIVGADTGDVDKQLQKLERQAASLKKQLEKPINANVKITVGKELDKVNAEIAKLRQQKVDLQISGTSIQGLKNLENGANKATASLNKLKGAAPNATYALSNLSRVAQDAPFGFIGIANNIDPLIQSFISLKRESGSTKNALLALGTSLAGGGGLVLLTGLASAALTLFGDKIFSSGKAAKKSQEELEDYNNEIKNIGKNLASEATNVTTLVNAINSGTLNTEQRKKALSELASINKQYFGGLKDEEGLVQNLNVAYNSYLKSLAKIGQAKAIEAQIKRLFDKKLELELSVNTEFQASISTEQQAEIARLQAQLTAAGGAITEQERKNQNVFVQSSEEFRKREDLQSRINKLKKGENILLYEGNKLEKDKTKNQIAQIDSQIKSLSLLQQGLGNFNVTTTQKQASGKTSTSSSENVVTEQEAAQKILDIQNRLAVDLLKSQKNITKNEREEIKLRGEQRIAELKKAYDKERAEEEAKIFQNAADKKKVLDALDTAFLRTVTTVRTEVLFELLDYNAKVNDFTKSLRDKVDKDIREKPISATWPVDIKIQAKTSKETTDALIKQGEDLRNTINETFSAGLADSFGELSSSIGDILSGGNFGQNIAKAGQKILGVIGGVLQQLGKLIIKAAITVEVMKKALASLIANPAASLAVGGSLIALGAILKNIKLAKIPALAEGGIVTGPTLSLIGEKGSEAVIPLDKLSGMMIAAVRAAINPTGARGLANTGDQRLVTEIRGSSLALVLQRTNQTSSRLG